METQISWAQPPRPDDAWVPGARAIADNSAKSHSGADATVREGTLQVRGTLADSSNPAEETVAQSPSARL